MPRGRIMPSESEYRQQDESLFICATRQIAIFLWKDWSRDMEAVASPQGNFSLRGICPHTACKRSSAFLMVASMHQIATTRVVAMMQCQACLSFILAIANRQTQMNHVVYYYQEHYPMGLPDDKTPDEIPAEIQSEFKEAIRCEWLRAYRACVLMCRRSLQISCDKELLEVLDHEPTEADKKQNSRKDLFTHIDELKEKGRITE